MEQPSQIAELLFHAAEQAIETTRHEFPRRVTVDDITHEDAEIEQEIPNVVMNFIHNFEWCFLAAARRPERYQEGWTAVLDFLHSQYPWRDLYCVVLNESREWGSDFLKEATTNLAFTHFPHGVTNYVEAFAASSQAALKATPANGNVPFTVYYTPDNAFLVGPWPAECEITEAEAVVWGQGTVTIAAKGSAWSHIKGGKEWAGKLVVSCPEDFQSRVAWGLRDISEKAVEFIGVGQEAPLADYEEFSSNYGLANAHKETTGAVPGQIQHARDRIGKLGNGAANRGGGEPEREYEFKRRDTPDEGSFVMDSDDEE